MLLTVREEGSDQIQGGTAGWGSDQSQGGTAGWGRGGVSSEGDHA